MFEFVVAQDPPPAEVVVTGPASTPQSDLEPTVVEDIVVVGRRDSVERWTADEIDGLLLDDVGEVVRALRARSLSQESPQVFVNGRRIGTLGAIADLPAEALEAATLREGPLGPEIHVELTDSFSGGRVEGRLDLADRGSKGTVEGGWTRTARDRVINVVAAGDREVADCLAEAEGALNSRITLGMIDLATEGVQTSSTFELRRHEVTSGGVVGLDQTVDLGASRSAELSGGASWMASVHGSANWSSLRGLGATARSTHQRLHTEVRVDGVRPWAAAENLTVSTVFTLEGTWGGEADRRRGTVQTTASWTPGGGSWTYQLDTTAGAVGDEEHRVAAEVRWRGSSRLSASMSASTQTAPQPLDRNFAREAVVGQFVWRTAAGDRDVLGLRGGVGVLDAVSEEALTLSLRSQPFESHDFHVEAEFSSRRAVNPAVSLSADVTEWADVFPDRLEEREGRTVALLGPFNLRENRAETVGALVRYSLADVLWGDDLELVGRALWPLSATSVTRDGIVLEQDRAARLFGLAGVAPSLGANLIWRHSDWVAVMDVADRPHGAAELNLRWERRYDWAGAKVDVGVGIDNALGGTDWSVSERPFGPIQEEPRFWISLRHAAGRE